jgi:mannosyltransferase
MGSLLTSRLPLQGPQLASHQQVAGDGAAARDSAELFVTNFNRRFTGVSSTANGVVSQQLQQHAMQLVGHPLPLAPEPISLWQAIGCCRRRPANRPFAIWHVRRNAEMLAGLLARDVLKLPIRLVFTSAAKRRHSFFPRQLISRMDAVIATTPTAAELVPHVAAVVPHGVDIERFTPPTDRRQAWEASGFPGRFGIGIVGRIRPEKGTDLFVDAMLRVLPQRPDFTAVIIGRAAPEHAAFEQELKSRIQAANLTERVVFAGEIPAARMPEMTQSLSLLVASPRYEGFGMTALEAMAGGAAVVATNTGAFAEMIVEGQTGHVVPIGDLAALTGAILSITKNPEHLDAAGQAARQHVAEHFTLAGEVAGIEQVYQRLWNGERF